MNEDEMKSQLEQIAVAVRNNECVLFLGPHLARVQVFDKEISLNELLSNKLADEVNQLGALKSTLIDKKNLSYVAQRLEDSIEILKREGNPSFKEHPRAVVGNIFLNFFKEYEHYDKIPEVFNLLAELPFKHIINTSPDRLLVKAYENNNNLLASENAKFFHYNDPTHNNDEDNWPKEITEDTPLIYNLFGQIDKPYSLVITEKDQLEFIDTILQKESHASIPASIAIHFVSDPQIMRKKTFLFLGFDFGDWRIKLIMHLIHRYQNDWTTYTTLFDALTLSDIEKFFYQKNFNVHFNEIPPLQFLTAFKKIYDDDKKILSNKSKIKVFIMYHYADEQYLDALERHLAPVKRNDIIETWNHGSILPGSNASEVVSRNIVEADIIIQLVSSDFLASNEIYHEQVEIALERHYQKKAIVVPIIIRPCVWKSDRQMVSLKTILPAPRGFRAVTEMVNLEKEWQKITEHLEKIIELTIKRKFS